MPWKYNKAGEPLGRVWVEPAIPEEEMARFVEAARKRSADPNYLEPLRRKCEREQAERRNKNCNSYFTGRDEKRAVTAMTTQRQTLN